MIVYGTGMYGKVDEVEGFCWTATQFGHIYWIPLIPTGSYIVTGEDGDGIQGLKVPLNGKSVGVAYLQGLLLATTIGCLIGGISTGSPFAWGGFALARRAKRSAGLPCVRRSARRRPPARPRSPRTRARTTSSAPRRPSGARAASDASSSRFQRVSLLG